MIPSFFSHEFFLLVENHLGVWKVVSRFVFFYLCFWECFGILSSSIIFVLFLIADIRFLPKFYIFTHLHIQHIFFKLKIFFISFFLDLISIIIWLLVSNKRFYIVCIAYVIYKKNQKHFIFTFNFNITSQYIDFIKKVWFEKEWVQKNNLITKYLKKKKKDWIFKL